MRQIFLCHRKKQILCPAVGTVRMKRLLQLEKGKRRCRPYKSAFLYGWERKNAMLSVQERVSVWPGRKKMRCRPYKSTFWCGRGRKNCAFAETANSGSFTKKQLFRYYEKGIAGALEGNSGRIRRKMIPVLPADTACPAARRTEKGTAL